ncbi:MAG: hypothetical protein AAFV69_00660 [Pseudomonadota bacterium]
MRRAAFIILWIISVAATAAATGLILERNNAGMLLVYLPPLIGVGVLFGLLSCWPAFSRQGLSGLEKTLAALALLGPAIPAAIMVVVG